MKVVVLDATEITDMLNKLFGLNELEYILVAPGHPQVTVLAGRPVAQVGRPKTGQTVLLLGAVPAPQAVDTGAGSVGDSLPQLRSLLASGKPDIVILDAPRASLEELAKEVSDSGGPLLPVERAVRPGALVGKVLEAAAPG